MHLGMANFLVRKLSKPRLSTLTAGPGIGWIYPQRKLTLGNLRRCSCLVKWKGTCICIILKAAAPSPPSLPPSPQPQPTQTFSLASQNYLAISSNQSLVNHSLWTAIECLITKPTSISTETKWIQCVVFLLSINNSYDNPWILFLCCLRLWADLDLWSHPFTLHK